MTDLFSNKSFQNKSLKGHNHVLLTKKNYFQHCLVIFFFTYRKIPKISPSKNKPPKLVMQKTLRRGRSRGRVQGVHTLPPPRDDLRFSNTIGILQKKKLCGLLVLK